MEFIAGHAVKKRYKALTTSALYRVLVSTQKALPSAMNWMHNGVEALTGEIPMDYAIEQITSLLNATRAHPQRDKDSLSMKPRMFEANFVDGVTNI